MTTVSGGFPSQAPNEPFRRRYTPPAKRAVNPSERAIDDRWAARIDALIAPPSRLLSTSVYEIISAEGYTGSYPSVVRHVRARRGPRFRVAPQVSVPIETGP
jgi:hypothetical protein